jgi:hypothetical protein
MVAAAIARVEEHRRRAKRWTARMEGQPDRSRTRPRIGRAVSTISCRWTTVWLRLCRWEYGSNCRESVVLPDGVVGV